ncbi:MULTISPECIES: hypothetical protein [Pseudofrankia]|uniref:hypothetical protein n=1 Tax=Pseudofrankia TaxID=2994363 RepID=UPI000234C8CA|nr:MULTISPECIES: hypothetical protein [Pseudofrankia]OHV35830.1 hypothetical protein BCD49_21355 [Pseudofrankia sp. EUN1h]
MARSHAVYALFLGLCVLGLRDWRRAAAPSAAVTSAAVEAAADGSPYGGSSWRTGPTPTTGADGR